MTYERDASGHILIVDDNQNNCDLLSRRLSRQGYSCMSLNSGVDALDALKHELPDIILLDVMMPEMDGFEVLEIIRREHTAVELPVLMVTAKNAHEDIVKAFELGANDYIDKPVDFPVLLARIKHHLLHKQLDDEFRRSQQQLQEQNALLDKSNQYKVNFLSSMSHELRTPLNSILGYSELLIEGLMGELTDKQKEYCKEIYDSGKYLLVIINDLLDLSKIEAGKMTLDIEPTEIAPLVSSVIGILKEKADRHGVSLVTSIQENLESTLLDPVRIKQILINLVTNAIKFTQAGRMVALNVFLESDELVLQVTDEGCGIPNEEIQRIFLPFEQVESPIKTNRAEGTGLGLALVNKLTLLHEGTVTVESDVGKGSVFAVRLPYCRDVSAAEGSMIY